MMVMVQRCDTILCILRAVTTEELPTESTTWNLTEKLNENLTKNKPMSTIKSGAVRRYVKAVQW